MTSPTPITFYDIASSPPLRAFAANPWKTRFALNYKGLPYRTHWVDMPSIATLRQTLGVPANRTLPDGTPFHTLPLIHDAATNALLGDSFEIALYLETAYPSHPPLFRPSTTGLTAAFNAHVDALFTRFATLCTHAPFDPRVADAVGAMFAARVGAMAAELQQRAGAQPGGVKVLVAFEQALGELAKAYRHTGGTTDYVWRAGGTGEAQRQRAPTGLGEGGPFLDGDEPVYADFVVGAWLKMMEASMSAEDWGCVRTWQGGLWGRVVDALDRWSEIK
ncbi:hypothetical protein LTR08_004851 [Meristemomyces frigidus]|nr:hypothetical protein LTR08_004851 [Meristemomyces frigidus]